MYQLSRLLSQGLKTIFKKYLRQGAAIGHGTPAFVRELCSAIHVRW